MTPASHPTWSLRQRLAWQLTLGAGAVLALLFVLLDVLIDREIYAHLDQTLALRGEVIAHTLQREHDDLPLSEYQEDSHTEFYTLYGADGRVQTTSPNSHGLTLPRPSPEMRLPRYYDAALPDGHPGRLLALPHQIPTDPAHPGILVVGTERTRWDAVERRVHGLLMGGIALALLAVILVSLWLVSRGFGYVEQVRRQLSTLDPDQPVQLPDDLPRELSPFVHTLQTGVERLRQAVQRERRFAHDMAHELRTPVSEIRASAESALEQVQDPAARAALVAVLEGGQRMQRSIESLLALARIESGLEQPAADPFDLCALLRELLAHGQARAGQRGLQLTATLPPEAWCRSDAGMLERLLSNLLDNALEYAPRNSRVHCHLWHGPNGPVVTLENPAPTLEPADLTWLGQRFWRKHDAATPRQHAGLGLALCRALADACAIPLAFTLEEGRLRVQLGPLPPL
ncbi:MAG: sensor histidine kinase [Thermomonas hydrothermalis]|uniref:sensor histidine kinase n=1 Tax=Thermomonas hydrothermalis TaxID=213588 RepID=UPI002354B20F|nr:histidine kinase dimerization/phospho-acceptor domain-containing protein [Thermomonas hydrothermalis]MCL6619534.1 sensor histidine kinase [Thermomonas hydrothermalis]